jgi:hypothetical protein
VETRTIYIEKAEAEELQQFLKHGRAHEDCGECEVVETLTADFGKDEDGYPIQADIKVCNGNPPYIDAVIFVNNVDSGCLEPSDDLLGNYVFWLDDESYEVIIEEKKEPSTENRKEEKE